MAKAQVLEIVETQDPGTKRPHVRYDANLDGKNVGFAIIASPIKGDPPGEMALRAFYVAPQHRGTGLATKLMIHALTQNAGRRVALYPRPYEEIKGKEPPKSTKQLKAMYRHYGFHASPTRPRLMVQKTAQESAAGIPDRSLYGDTASLPIDELLNYVTQEHDAVRAGRHTDLRFGADDLHSWAVPKGMPEPGERHLAIAQPLHAGSYAGFEGEIPAGEYGAGTVKVRERGTVLVTKAEPGIVNFVVTHKKYPERFSLVRTKERNWLLLNTTPVTSEALKAHKKVHYTIVDPKDVEKVLDGSYAVSAKIDGASALFSILKDKIEAISYRTDTRGRPIIHTHRIPGLSPTKPPKELHGTVLGGEIYAERGGKTLEPQEIGGLLNASTETSRRKQIGEKIKMKAAIFRVLHDKGKLVDEGAPYAQQMARLQEIVKSLPRDVFNLPPTETDPQRARELYEKIRSGKFPLTGEGIVATPLAGGKPSKVKFRQEQDVWIRNIFPAVISSGPPRAGGFEYSYTPEGETIGRVGGGFSHETLRDMLANPDKYVGRMARVASQGRFPKTTALRAPGFISLHEDYPADAKTAEAKLNYTKVHGHAKERVGSIGWYFHNMATHGNNVGYQHCVGGPANPYKLRHHRVDGKIQHEINKEYARGHGTGNQPTWFHFRRKTDKGWWDLDSAVKVDVANAPKRYKVKEAADKKKIVAWTTAEKAVFKTKHGKDPLLATYGVSFFKDPNGYFCATHRCRSKSKSAPDKVTATEIARIEKTGAAKGRNKLRTKIKKDAKGFTEISFKVCGDAVYSMAEMLEYIRHTGAPGHSFGIEVDPEDRTRRMRFGFDGDGSDRIEDIRVSGTEAVFESDDDGNEWSWTAVRLPTELSKQVLLAGNAIPDDEIYDEEGYGREDEPHVTVMWGLDTDDPDDVKNALAGEPGGSVEVTGISTFENDDYKVLKLDVKSAALARLHDVLDEELECPGNSFPKYHPHITLAYLKKDADETRYTQAKDSPLIGKKFNFTSLMYRNRAKEETAIPLGQKKIPPDQKKEAALKPPTIKLPTVLEKLKEIKALSDKRQYGAKHSKLQALLLKSPQKFIIDSEGANIVGITHTPTGFRFHVPREVIAGLTLGKAASTNFLVKMAVISGECRLPLLVEVAEGVAAERQGLGGRACLPDNFGMLFKRASSFWMRDCHFSLDLAFLDKAGTILEIQHMPQGLPGQPLPHYTAKVAGAISAIELPSGWCARNMVWPGASLQMR